MRGVPTRVQPALVRYENQTMFFMLAEATRITRATLLRPKPLRNGRRLGRWSGLNGISSPGPPDLSWVGYQRFLLRGAWSRGMRRFVAMRGWRGSIWSMRLLRNGLPRRRQL